MEHLENADDMAAYLEAVLEDGDPVPVAATLGDIARAKGMTKVTQDALNLSHYRQPEQPGRR